MIHVYLLASLPVRDPIVKLLFVDWQAVAALQPGFNTFCGDGVLRSLSRLCWV